MPPEHLAHQIETHKADSVLILSIGYENVIKDSIQLGPAKDETQLDSLKAYLKNVPKDQEIVIYCGCCPFDKCPNIRPAITLLNEMGFENAHLLNLGDNIKVDWLDKGYPEEQ